MELLKFVVLLVAFGIFAGVILSMFVAVLTVWTASFAALLGGREKKRTKGTADIGRLAGQEGM